MYFSGMPSGKSSHLRAYSPTRTPRSSEYQTRSMSMSAAKSAPRGLSTGGESRISFAPGGIMSSSSKRASSFFKSSGGQNAGFKDTRNLTDREVQQAMVRKIFGFLSDNEFPFPLSEKTVRSPTKTDFVHIFEFVYKFLDPNYTLQGKVEDEVPRLFRDLGYPVLLKQSTMQTIGASHTMPYLLGALTFLIDVVKIANALSPEDLLLSSEEGDGQRRSLGYGYTVRCYKKLMNDRGSWTNPASFKDETDNLVKIMDEREDIAMAKAELDARQAALLEEEESLEKNQDELMKLAEEILTAKADIQKVEAYLTQVEEVLKSFERKKFENGEMLLELAEKITKTKEEVAILEEQISIQKLSGEEARALRNRRIELKENMTQMNEELGRLEMEICSVDAQIHKDGNQLREKYHMLVRDMKVLGEKFSAADNSFILQMQERSPNEPAFSQFLPVIEDHLATITSKINDTLDSLSKKKASVQQGLTELNAEKETKKEKLSRLQRDAQRQMHEQSLKQEDWADEIGKKSLELDVAKNELDGLLALRSGNLDAHEQLANAKKEYQARKLELDEERRQVILEVTKRLELIVEERENIRKYRELLVKGEKHLREACDEYISSALQDLNGRKNARR